MRLQEKGAAVSRSSRIVIQALWLAGLVAMAAPPLLSAQSLSWATLSAPPTEALPPGDVVRAGHLGREIADTQNIIHFYSDLIGFGLVGARDATRNFMVSHPLAEFAELGEGDQNAYDSVSRVALLPIPGTALKAGDPEMTIEAIEIKGIKSQPYHPAMSDPGASYIKIIVRDLDKTLAALKAERTPVITQAGNPVELSWPGIGGRIRAIFVRDPDGYPVQLMEITPTPASTAAANARVLGARVTLVVDNLEETCRMYQSLVGPDFKFWLSPTLMGDKTYEGLSNTPGQFRLAQAMVPGSPVVMEFIEYKTHSKTFRKANIQDPGTAHFLFMSKDDDVMIQRVHAAKLHTLSKSNAPVYLSPTVRSFFVPDPQGFWMEFMDRDAKRDPNAK
jgi:catechol 2,3-dioxygenase-like lactoylglutathione lyase family enzyme